ncbi:Uncharacterised protein [Corynebacterium renale]|uniref:Uncharacterized protein n=1 Tax=Corynebacterium renale TaxID=1724 RepID=A0A2A9DSP6_9CORY|nr:hypothetical protein [Corynebacterium renale]PFG28960.1 hypothetical protein ATK06_2090 [Corynebacterium renale]SQG64446.1 Uncharacterised protein [Corynebacterium renale]SQI25521.1 Uncharacterised protein [Corynebacterium renale]STC95296.1 Uncharacterised protein [Corynebacterium renale]
MSFYEDIATKLDEQGIESRVGGDVLFVPVTADFEVRFVEIDPLLPAANVYIAAADVDERDDDFSEALVSVVFSVEDAVRTVAHHVATDETVTLLRDLIEGTDERVAAVEFFQDTVDPQEVRAVLTDRSDLVVRVVVEDEAPVAHVWVETWEEEPLEVDLGAPTGTGEDSAAEPDSQLLTVDALLDLFDEPSSEVLELGTFKDFDKLFDALSLAVDHVEDWEAELVPVDDDYADFDDCGDDEFGEDFADGDANE